jgi:hypothetical protein
MTGPSPAQLFRGRKPSAYQAAVVLSGVSALLGLGREVLVVKRLGISEANDRLQLALSITYSIALLGEPLRLAALNLLQRRLSARLWAAIGSGIAVAAAITTVLYRAGAGTVPWNWVLIAGTAGAANLFLAWVLPRSQRSGPLLPVHAVTVMPNLFVVAVLLLPTPSTEAFATRVVGLFLAAPLLQLAALAVLSRFGDHPELGPPLSAAEGLRPIAWHAAGAVGGQAAQLLMRTALMTVPGLLTGFNLILRATETLRAIFVDTYIASRVRRWASGERITGPAVDGRWLSPLALATIAAGALVLALVWNGRPDSDLEKLLSPASMMVVIGSYLVLALRVRYQSLNTSAQPMVLVRRMAGLEVIAALAVGLLSALPGAPVALLPWIVYVAKPAAGLRLVSSQPNTGVSLAPEA